MEPLPPIKERTYWISITGLRLKRSWHIVPFLWHATRAFRQAERSPGCLRAESRRTRGVFHTLTVWDSQDCVKAFLYKGAHGQAARSFSRYFEGKTFGYQSSEIPDWDEVRRLYEEHGQDYR